MTNTDDTALFSRFDDLAQEWGKTRDDVRALYAVLWHEGWRLCYNREAGGCEKYALDRLPAECSRWWHDRLARISGC